MKGNKVGNLRNFYEIESIFNNLKMVLKERRKKKSVKKFFLETSYMSLLDWFPFLKHFFLIFIMIWCSP